MTQPHHNRSDQHPRPNPKVEHPSERPPVRTLMPNWLSGDRRLIFLFAFVDLILIVLAHRHFSNFKRMTSDPFLLRPAEVEEIDLSRIQKLSSQGSWEALEHFQTERLTYYQATDVRPSANTSLYFFPELLTENSFEKQFAMKKLRPALANLKLAQIKHDVNRTAKAYELLRTRVQNYEIGGTSSTDALSREAKFFLDAYASMSRLNLASPAGSRPHTDDIRAKSAKK